MQQHVSKRVRFALKPASEIDKKAMPKKLVSWIMPHPDKVAHMRQWGWLGRQLFATDLWHLNRRTVALAFMNGLFWACMPMPLQMGASALCALLIRCNVPISVGLVWLTNPITMPPYYLAAYNLGAWILGSEPISMPDAVTFEWIQDQLNLIWLPLLTGALVFGILAASLGYVVIRFWWSMQIRRNYLMRKSRLSANGRDGVANNDPSDLPPDGRA